MKVFAILENAMTTFVVIAAQIPLIVINLFRNSEMSDNWLDG